MKQSHAITDADILKEIIAPGRRDLNPEAAKSILDLHFSRSSTARIRSLLRANNRGAISPQQRIELEKYLRVGQLLDLLQAKARLTLETPKRRDCGVAQGCSRARKGPLRVLPTASRRHGASSRGESYPGS